MNIFCVKSLDQTRTIATKWNDFGQRCKKGNIANCLKTLNSLTEKKRAIIS